MATTEDTVDLLSKVIRNANPVVTRSLSGITITINGQTLEVPFSSSNQVVSNRKIY